MPRLRVGLNLLYLIPGVVGGTETYAVELIRSLGKVDQENEYYVFVNRESAATLRLQLASNFHLVPCLVRAKVRALRYGWEQTILPWQLAAKRIDLVHSLAYVAPLFATCPSVVTIHDANFVRLRNTMSVLRSNVLGFVCRHSARRASRVISVSEFSRQELVRYCGVPAHNVTVVHSGPGSSSDEAEEQVTRAVVDAPYLLAFCGTIHKNTARLIEAFAGIVHPVLHRLVLIGRETSDVTRMLAALPVEVRDRVRITGYVDRGNLNRMLRQAALFVVASTYEGFGLPLLEAQSVGCVTACSTAASLPEVGGPSVAYFDPYSVPEMRTVISRCLTDASFIHELRLRGFANVRRFSWEKTAVETLAVYRAVAEKD